MVDRAGASHYSSTYTTGKHPTLGAPTAAFTVGYVVRHGKHNRVITSKNAIKIRLQGNRQAGTALSGTDGLASGRRKPIGQ